MKTHLNDGQVEYKLQLFNRIEPGESKDMNELVGQHIGIQFEGEIHCVATGRKIKKTYGEGLSYTAFLESPLASPSIIRPELSRIHEGIALRDKEWEEKHHNVPHVVYVALTAGVKVGVTNARNVPFRWIDQGASEAIILAETPYRQLAGAIEVELKQHVSDVTNWRRMLKNDLDENIDLLEYKEHLAELLPGELYDFVSEDDDITSLHYPVLRYPEKVKSMKLDKVPLIEKKLVGIKGQYLIFEDDTVINIRSHSGYEVALHWD